MSERSHRRSRAPRSRSSEASSAQRDSSRSRNGPGGGNQRAQHLLRSGAIQTELEVGSVDDPLEKQASRTAHAVESGKPAPCACGGTCSKCKGKKDVVRRSPSSGSSARSQERALEGLDSGRRLGPDSRRFFESRLGGDFSGVRVHSGEGATASAAGLGANAYTAGQDIVFGQGQYAPGTPRGRRLLAHELTHVMQQSGGGRTPKVQRDPKSGPPVLKPGLPTFGPLPLVLGPGDFNVVDSGKEAILSYKHTRQVHIKVISTVGTGKAYAYQYLPPISKRAWPIIRVVAAPGTSVSLKGFPTTAHLASGENPSVEIYRAQDPELVPGEGEAIKPSNFVGTSDVGTTATTSGVVLLPAPVVVNRRGDGVDIVHTKHKMALRISAPTYSAKARYSYHVDLGTEAGLTTGTPTIVTIVKTPAVEVKMLGVTRSKVVYDFSWRVYEVDDISKVPNQGEKLAKTGTELKSIPAEVSESLEETLGTTAVDTAIGLIPIVGDAVDITEFVYGLSTGKDRWGRKLTFLDKALMGIGAVLPFVSGSLLRGARKIGSAGYKAIKALGKSGDEMSKLAKGVATLSDAELGKIRRWDEMLRRGESLPAGEISDARRILSKIGRAVSASGEVVPTDARSIRTLLNSGGTGFSSPDLQAAYRRYLSEAGEAVGPLMSPSEWARTTAGRTRALFEAALGPHGAAAEFASNANDYLAAVRREAAAGGGLGRSWDWHRFPELPPGKKWKVGDPIDMPNTKGEYPDWNGVGRERFWKNSADRELKMRGPSGGPEPGSVDPLKAASNDELRDMLSKGTAPPDPMFPGRKFEVEHAGVPQRVVGMLTDLMGGKSTPGAVSTARRLAGVSDPSQLMEVSRVEHAFFDAYAHTLFPGTSRARVNPLRFDIEGKAWGSTLLGDVRVARPLERMNEATLRTIIDRATSEGLDFGRTAKTRALRDAINLEITARGLSLSAIP